MAQSAIQWLEAAGVDCSALKEKLQAASDSAAHKVFVNAAGETVKEVEGVALDRMALAVMVRNFVDSPPVVQKLVDEVLNEAEAEHNGRDPVKFVPKPAAEVAPETAQFVKA